MATVTFHEVEQSGPPSPPLGFPAPRVYPATISLVTCRQDDGSNAQLLGLKRQRQLDSDRERFAYLMPGVTIQETICGEVRVCCELEAHGDEYQRTGRRVAVKMDRRSVMSRLHGTDYPHPHPENPWKEISAFELLGNDNANVVPLLDALQDDIYLYMILPFYSNSLYTLLHVYPRGLPEHRARRYFRQIIAAIEQLHLKGVCHRDISPQNILIDDRQDRCLLSDLGMSLRIPYSFPDDHTTEDCTDVSIGTVRRLIHSQSHCGKLAFMAPEMYAEQDLDGLAIDLWSAAAVFFYMLTGRPPYRKPDPENDRDYHDLLDPYYYWDAIRVPQELSWGCSVSADVVDLLSGMFRPDPRHRLTLAQVLIHPACVDKM